MDDHIENVRKNFDRRKQIRLELERNPWKGVTEFEMPGVRILHSQESELVLEFNTEEYESMSIMNRVAENQDFGCIYQMDRISNRLSGIL